MMVDGRNNQDPMSRIPGNLPLFNTGWGAGEWDFEPGEGFWEQAAKMGADSGLADQMDLAMEGKSAPRVWLILHEPGQPELSAAVALAFARELGARDQAALVLDCDDQSQALTRWAERIESEGWIDLARYGTSVLTSGVAMPFGGRRGYFLGVGSFAPTDVTAEEIQQLVKRLRRQADDLILVAPADGIGEIWASVAGIRLLCWDRANRPVAEIEGLVASMAEVGGGLTGLVGFGLPMNEPVESVEPVRPAAPEDPVPVLDDRPDPAIAEPGNDEVDPAPPADDFEAPVSDEAPDEISTEPVADLAAEAKDEAEAETMDEARTDREDDDGWADATAYDAADPVRKGTSGVFWFAASAAVIIVAILGVYWFKYVRVPQDEEFQPVEVAAQGAPLRVPGDRSQGDMANQDDPSIEETVRTAVDSLVTDPADGIAASPGNESASQTTAESQVEEGVATATADEDASGQQLGAAGPFEPRPSAPEESVFLMEPYRSKVGGGGWALHLYSFPDSSGTDAELAELHRRGFETEVRVVETREKGRWWRVYVGNFASRAEARAAAPLLKTKLRTDWANPTRF